MSVSVKFTPAEFGKLHRELFESVVGPRAAALGAKTLSNKVHRDMAYAKKDGDLGLIYDNVQQVAGAKKGAIPLKEAYALDEQLAIEAAEQAAKTTGGVLTSASAKFLPVTFRKDFERVTGAKIDGQAGVAVKGVDIKKAANGDVQVKVEFKKALAGVKAKEVVLAVAEHFLLTATRLNPPLADPKAPPYYLAISPRDGAMWPDTFLLRGRGLSGFTDPSEASLIHAGTETVKLVDQNNTKTYEAVTFEVDAVNGRGDQNSKPPSAATKIVRETWGKCFNQDEIRFDFDKALKDGTFVEKKLSEVRNTPGMNPLFSSIREATGFSITKLVKDNLLQFYVDTKTKSMAVLRSYDGESGGHLSIIDPDKKRWVGSFDFGDDGTIEWNER
jgi:hypothetical protein